MPRPSPSIIRGPRLGLALVAGLLITVALAWTAMFIPTSDAGYGPPATDELGLTKTSDGGKIWQITEGRNAWHHVVQYWHMQISGVSLMMPTADFEARRFDLERLPSYLQPDSVDKLNMMAWYREVGFPWPALTCSVHWKRQILNADIIYDVNGGVQLPRDRDFRPRALSLTPVWPGFLLDVLLWSFAAWLIRWCAGAGRSQWRVWRGRCRRCGYLQTGLPLESRCPECGADSRARR